MKLAIVTNDNRTINAHFGRARAFLVLTIEEGEIAAREVRDKAACDHSGHGHGADPNTAAVGNVSLTDGAPAAIAPVGDSHQNAVDLIADCTAVLSRGMGKGMYAALQQAGVRPVLTNLLMVERAVAAYLDGTLKEHPDLVH